ncbi:MAG: caspase family protein, partial [Candidatus Hydrogenedentes bacterium]|nr:caspase family protein [Candidatus Hydrogenedentota bacterium]
MSASTPTAPQKWALVVGVGDYQDAGISDLPKAVNDARAITQMLIAMPDGFPERNVLLLADTEGEARAPTRANMMRFLTSRLALVAEEDTVLVYFAGHGTTDGGALYLLPSDASLSNVAFTGFPFAQLEKVLEDTPARKKILILDACHSGTGRATETMSDHAIAELERASEGMVTLASCSGEELSHEMP